MAVILVSASQELCNASQQASVLMLSSLWLRRRYFWSIPNSLSDCTTALCLLVCLLPFRWTLQVTYPRIANRRQSLALRCFFLHSNWGLPSTVHISDKISVLSTPMSTCILNWRIFCNTLLCHRHVEDLFFCIKQNLLRSWRCLLFEIVFLFTKDILLFTYLKLAGECLYPFLKNFPPFHRCCLFI